MTEKRIQPLTIFSLNCYLMPKWFNRYCINQATRASEIGKFSKKNKDFIVLQEMWGSNVDKIVNEIYNTHTILPRHQSRNFGGYLPTVLDTLRYYWNKNGGLWFSCKNELHIKYNNQYTYTISGTKSNKGIFVCLLDISPYWENQRHLIIFNTHLDPSHFPIQQSGQLKELQYFIAESLKDVFSKFPNMQTKDCSVLIFGDFNLGQNSNLYLEIQNLFNGHLRDLFAEKVKEGKTEAGNTFEHANSYNPWEMNERIDYVFALDDFNYENRNYEFMSVICDNITIVKQPKGQEFSDHWGLETVLMPSLTIKNDSK